MTETTSPITVPNGDSWTSITFLDEPAMDDQFKYELSMMHFGMTDMGECFEALRSIVVDDEESWIQAWTPIAERLQAQAEEAERRDKPVSAASAYLRASTYWRASLMHFGMPDDPREAEHARASYRCYDRYLALSGYPGEYMEIPYERSVLPAYLYRSPVAQPSAPLLIFHQGRDAWADDTRWVYDGAMKRGIHCLALHGPGQGLAIRLNHLPFRPDWEKVITPTVDVAVQIEGVDPGRIGLKGASFGGYLAPRAAAFEHRIKILIANPGVLSWGASIMANFPPDMLDALEAGPDVFNPIVEAAMEVAPTTRWFLRDSMWKHGVATPFELMGEFQACDLTPYAADIECETLIMDGTQEVFSTGQGQLLYDALTCPKEYMLFDESTTAQLHCQNGATAIAGEYMFDWLDERL